jgi:hypothetical protein
MITHEQRSMALADKITAKAEDVLSSLDREVAGWPNDFAAIMWESVAIIATQRAQLRRLRDTK